ncbi:MAG TPA: M6 family metalloprotease domain-containing protein, partial [Thermoanaerobaculia bacterium]|nr:M6 family metalloprotease domain-containing protein [Thermoanaerobaculia bacterium]
MRSAVSAVRAGADRAIAPMIGIRRSTKPGLDDGTIFPPNAFPLGTPMRTIRSAAAQRAPLRGNVNVVVVLVDFSDRPMTTPVSHFEDLFFSRNKLPNGSVADYFDEVSSQAVQITGRVAGPFRLPKTIRAYAHGEAGTGDVLPNARTMARDAALAAKPHINFAPFDNDGNGFIDAFIVIHAGSGAEESGNNDEDIWSHKWVLDGDTALPVNGKQIFAYLTVPEDARIGVCCHELGHLVFGWPDLYDVDNSSEGVGNWCLMGGGSWNGPSVGSQPGDVPAHPSAWCKNNQGWVTVTTPSTNGSVTIDDVKTSRTILRLWKNGDTQSQEHFLAENRGRTGYDRALPGEGLLVWHIDDALDSNRDENHYKVALLQADGRRDLERAANRGDAGDSYPGTTGNASITAKTTPSSRSYAGVDSSVAITRIRATAGRIKANIAVKPATPARPAAKAKAKQAEVVAGGTAAPRVPIARRGSAKRKPAPRPDSRPRAR